MSFSDHTNPSFRSCTFGKDKESPSPSRYPSSAITGVVRKIEAVEKRRRQSYDPEREATAGAGSINSDPIVTESHGQPRQSAPLPETRQSASRGGLSDKEKLDLATLLTSPERLWTDFFSGVMDYASQAVGENLDEGRLDFNNTMEVSQARIRGEERLTHICRFPLKLILVPLKRGRSIVSTFARMLDRQFGPLHVALQVGDVILEWDDSSLVSPSRCDYEDRVMELGIQPHSKWFSFTREQHSRMRKAAKDLDFPEQIELTYIVASEKKKLIDNLIDVIVRYNNHHYYSLFSRNCQDFVREALEALEVKLPSEFTGGLGKYYKALIKGKTPSVPSEFPSHSALDRYILSKKRANTISRMPQHDLEYILTLYFRFHLESKSKLRKQHAALEEWECGEVHCCMEAVVELIKLESMQIYSLHRSTYNM